MCIILFVSRKLIQPNPENATLAELRTAIDLGSSTTRTRCLAILLLIMGAARRQVVETVEKTEDTLRNWIKRFNNSGIDGLIENRPGAPRKIPREKAAELREAILQPENIGRTFWTATAFHGFLKAEHQIECGYETVRRFFHEQGFALKVPRPWPERQGEERVQKARAKFRKALARWCDDRKIDLWYTDESGVEGEPRAYRRWAEKGSEPRVARNGDHIRMNVLGTVCPRTGEFFAIEASHCDTEMFQAFLDEAAQFVTPRRKRNLMIMDNASWHKSKSLNWHFFEPRYLPPYSPDLNPIEWLWLMMKKKWLNNIHCKTTADLMDHLETALKDLIDNPQQVAQTVGGNWK